MKTDRSFRFAARQDSGNNMPETPLSLGKVVVATAGTPVQLSATSVPVTFIRCSAFAGATGATYLGGKGLNKATGAGVIKRFGPNPSGGTDDSFLLPISDRETYNLSDFWIDAAVSGEGLIVSYGSAPL
jgi:hypothetical protein